MGADADKERAERSGGASPSCDTEPPRDRGGGAGPSSAVAAAPARRQARAKAVLILDSDDEAPGATAGASEAPTAGTQEAGPSGAAPTAAEAKAEGEQLKKRRRKGPRAGLELSDDELGAVFAELAGGKVTIGRAEFEAVVTRLDLDVSGDMVDAAFELLRDSGHAGACDRVDGRQFVTFLRYVAGVAGV